MSALSAQRRAPRPRLGRGWLAGHKEGVAYALIAAAMAIVVGTVTTGGFVLHRSALIERQSLRTSRLGSVAFQLHDTLTRAQTEKGVSARLAAAHARALEAAAATFNRVGRYDRDEGRRVAPSYAAYVDASSRAFGHAAAARGRIPAAEQRQVERLLTAFEGRVDAEIERQSREIHVTNPKARLILIVAATTVVLLVALLIWQFEMQRRAGRIDRDHAARSEELMRLRDEFVASVSHELRTPLTSILGYLELIVEDTPDARTEDEESYLAVVRRNADRLLRLVSDLLLVAEVENRAIVLDVRNVDLGELAQECVEAAQPAADAKQISLTLSRESPGRLEGDPIRLAQMMDNLVSNALKFTPAGGRVTVRAAAHDGHAAFEVEDSGPGISPADQAQLFEPFFRTQVAAARAVQGTGLGLTITKAIVEAHGGSISVESASGAGSTFRVRLPRTQVPSPPYGGAEAPVSRLGSAP